MRQLAVALVVAALVGLAQAPAARSAGTLVYVGNRSTTVTAQAVADALPAFQTMVSRDLGPAWGVEATLTTDPALEQQAEMTIWINDDSDLPGALGYHGTYGYRPTAFVSARTSALDGQAWPLVFSHELEEMLVDPWINRGILDGYRWWLVEVADPVASGYYAYWIGGVPISDFALPAWYDRDLAGPFDFRGRLRHAWVPGRHGYAFWWSPADDWTETTG